MTSNTQPVKRTDGYQFPWREGNQFKLLVDGRNYFPAMLQAIESAEQEILLEIYLVESGRVTSQFVEAFCLAARRGVSVLLLLDDFGTRQLSISDRTRLTSSGVRLKTYNPLRYGELRRNLWRDHRKLLVVDWKLAYVGGTGLTDAFLLDQYGPWHDLMLQLQGPCAADWRSLFAQTWHHSTGNDLHAVVPHAPPLSCTGLGRVTQSSGGRHKEIKRSLLKRIRTAERRVWLTSAYFIPSWKIRRLLRQAARRGVDVRLLLPGEQTDHPAVRHAGRRFYARLLRNGVRIFEYQPRFMHAKYMLVDHWSTIGSSNMDRWNMHWNLEANQEVEEQSLVDDLASLFQADLSDSIEIEAGSWLKRPWYTRLREWFWGLVDIWLLRLGRGRR